MKFSATVTLQYDTIFSSFSPADYLKGLDWMKANHLDGAELCISNYNNLDVAKIKDELDQRGLGCSTLSTGQARGLECSSRCHEEDSGEVYAAYRCGKDSGEQGDYGTYERTWKPDDNG